MSPTTPFSADSCYSGANGIPHPSQHPDVAATKTAGHPSRDQPPHGSTDARLLAAVDERVDLALDRLTDLGDAAEQLNHEEAAMNSVNDSTDKQERHSYPENFLASVVVPAFNEEKTVGTVIDQLMGLDLPLELILVDDSSTDGTRDVLQRYADLDNVHVISKPVNQGKGAALRTGFAQAVGDVIVIQDADLEYDPQQIPSLLPPLLDGSADVVYGSRFLQHAKQDQSWIHRFGNWLLTWASNRTTGLRLTDMETCYKAFRRDAIRGLTIEQDRFGFEPEITAKLARRGFRFSEVPIDYQPRGYREGKKIGVSDLFNAFYCILRYGHEE